MTGSPEERYNDVLCGLLYLRYSPVFPAQVYASLPSHTNPKSPSIQEGNFSGGKEPL